MSWKHCLSSAGNRLLNNSNMFLLTQRSSYLFTSRNRTLLISLLRPCSVSPSTTKKSPRIDKTKFRLVYNFPHITFPAAVSRLTISFPILTVVSLPIVYYIFENKTSLCIFIITGLIQSGISYLVSYITQNMVGKIYANKDGPLEDVVISSINRFGRRVDTTYKADEIIFCDYVTKLDNFLGFVSIGNVQKKEYYKVNIRNAQLIDPLICDYLLGKIHNINLVRETQLKAIEANKSNEVTVK